MYQAPLEAWDTGERSHGAPQARRPRPVGAPAASRAPWSRACCGRPGTRQSASASGSGLGGDARGTRPRLSTEEGWRGVARGDEVEAPVVREEAEPGHVATHVRRLRTAGLPRDAQRSAWRVSLSSK